MFKDFYRKNNLLPTAVDMKMNVIFHGYWGDTFLKINIVQDWTGLHNYLQISG